MKKFILVILVGGLLVLPKILTAADDTTPLPRLTVELRDGSRVVGQSAEATVSVRSSAMGELKLAWTGIRSIEYAANTDAARLTATNGDGFAVQLNADTLRLETDFGKTDLPVKLIRSIKVVPEPKRKTVAATPAARATEFRLTIELRDGSHIVGKGLDSEINFRSPTVGDLKLGWSGIRSVAYASEKSATARLTTTNGDAYEVEFVTSAVRVETSFGKTELPAKTIRSIKVAVLGNAAPANHLIGWWKLDEGNGSVAKDSSPTENPHNGTLINGPQWIKTAGHTEAALSFNGGNQYVSLGDIRQGSDSDISIACWVKHSRSQWNTVVGRGLATDPDDLVFMMDYNQTSASFGHYPEMVKSQAIVQDNQWHHVVGTMAKDSSGYTYSIYVDGKLDNTATGKFRKLFTNSNDWAIGARHDGNWGYRGLIKDVRIYDCVLSEAEVQAIYAEQNRDELPSAPAALGF